jgi:diguanylate cyclase (GGDEF)-like protein
MVTLPLQVDGQVVGLMLLGATERDFFDQDELLLLDEVSADVSFALQTIVEHERVEYLSYYDPLTGLPNRALLIDRVGQTMRARKDEDAPLALVLLNIERFRNINETFSRHGGDQLLRRIAQRLEIALGGKDHLARIGADAFGVMIPGVGDVARLAQTVEEQILGCFREPFVLDADEVRVAAQAGIASFPADADSSESLFGNAEAALKRARDHGDRYLFYTVEMNAKAAHVLTLETQLRKAVEEEQFVLHYQPKIDLATGSISGLEALLRWQHPQSGLVPPAQFIPLLEETGLILEAGRWALQRAMADHRRWSNQGLDPPRVAVNVSAIQLRRQDFVQTVFAAVQKDHGRPDCLEVEITESLLMQDIQSSIRKLSLLRDLDIHIAMDDFGTGYSSLSYLARLPISSVKIDRSFVSAMHTSPQDMSIVATIVALTRSLSIKVVAEGVETPEQHAALKDMGCNEAQGYLFSRPVPANEIAVLLRNDAVDCTLRNVGAGSR